MIKLRCPRADGRRAWPKAVAEYLRHPDPGPTLKAYAHLMPSSRAQARPLSGERSGHTA